MNGLARSFALGRLKTGQMNKTEEAYAGRLELLRRAGARVSAAEAAGACRRRVRRAQPGGDVMALALDVALFYELLEIAEARGAVEAGAAAEAALSGIAAAIVHIAGPKAAFNALQRWADAAASPLLQTGSVG